MLYGNIASICPIFFTPSPSGLAAMARNIIFNSIQNSTNNCVLPSPISVRFIMALNGMGNVVADMTIFEGSSRSTICRHTFPTGLAVNDMESLVNSTPAIRSFMSAGNFSFSTSCLKVSGFDNLPYTVAIS